MMNRIKEMMIGKRIHGNGSIPVSQARLLLGVLPQTSANRAGSSSLSLLPWAFMVFANLITAQARFLLTH